MSVITEMMYGIIASSIIGIIMLWVFFASLTRAPSTSDTERHIIIVKKSWSPTRK